MRFSLTNVAFISLALGGAVSACPRAAKADIVYVTVTGTVSAGTDPDGQFGNPGADLAGDVYTAQYEFDTSVGDTSNSPMQNYALGGPGYEPGTYSSPSLGASLTISGREFSIAGTYMGVISGYNNGTVSEIITEAWDESTEGSWPQNSIWLRTVMIGDPGTIPASITTAFSINSTGDSVAGVFQDDLTGIDLALTPMVYTEALSAPSAVPESASLTVFCTAIMVTGIVARRRRRTHHDLP